MTFEALGVDNLLNKIDTSILPSEVPSSGLESGELTGELFVNKGFIRSKDYIKDSAGWTINDDGTAQFADITLIGGIIKYGKTSFTDTVNAGYIMNSSGVYFGSANDVSYIKYNISTGVFTINAEVDFSKIIGATKPDDNADVTGDNQGDINTSNIVNGEGWTDDAAANIALGELDDMASDAKITPLEKLEAKLKWDAIVVEGTATTGTIPVQADSYSVDDTDFDTAFASLDTYLNTTISVFDDMTATTNATRTDWDTAWKNYYEERIKLLNDITDATALLAVWDSVTGLTKPADNADVTSVNLGGLYLTCATTESIQTKVNLVSAAGGGTVMLQNGTHTPGADITLPSNVYLKGLNTYGAIIDFESGAYGLKVIGTDAYSTGTLSISNGATAITGVGTTWIAGMVGRSIMLSGIWYPIVSRTSNTLINIGIPFAGETLSGATYVLANRYVDTFLENFTVQNSAAVGITIQYGDNVGLYNLVVQLCGQALSFKDSTVMNIDGTSMVYNAYGCSMENVHYTRISGHSAIDTFTGYGMSFDKCTSVSMGESFSINSAGNGFQYTDCSFMALDSCNAIENGGIGHEFISGCDNISMTSCGAQSNASDGIKLTATSDNNILTNNQLNDNGGYGINIANANCDDNFIRNNKYSGNTSGKYNDSGTSSIVDGVSTEIVDPENLVPMSDASLVGDTDVVLANFDTLGQGTDDGAFKVKIDGTERAVSVDFVNTGVEENKLSTGSAGSSVGVATSFSQGFTTLTNMDFITAITINITGVITGGSYNWRLTTGGDEGGTLLDSGTISITSSGAKVITMNSNIKISDSTAYNIKLTEVSSSSLITVTITSSSYSGGTMRVNGGVQGFDAFISVDGIAYENFSNLTEISTLVQAAIRTATSKTETFEYDTDHFVITGVTPGKHNGGEILKLTAPSTGTDISIATYLDLGTNATEVEPNGDDYKIVRLDENAALFPIRGTGGETINGLALPQPVFIDSSGNVIRCDADDANKLNFHGFCTNNTISTSLATVQTSGVVHGFTGLTIGSDYYVQDDKSIGTSVGSNTVLVGVAISATELLILH